MSLNIRPEHFDELLSRGVSAQISYLERCLLRISLSFKHDFFFLQGIRDVRTQMDPPHLGSSGSMKS